MSILQARAITKRFSGFAALEGVDFALEAGEIRALLGENGAGKSTLMNVLSGALSPTAGEIVLDGKPVRWSGPRDAAGRGGIGMVHQHFQLVPVFTVLENLTLGVQRSGVLLREREIERQAAEVADGLGWRISFGARTGDLPVGVQQRIEILKTLLLEPRILFFDEPTAVLTPGEAEDLFVVLRTLRDQGKSLVFVSHKLGEIRALCSRVTVLRRGKVAGDLAVADASEGDLARLMVGGEIQAIQPAPHSSPESSDDKAKPAVLDVFRLCSPKLGRDDVALENITFTVAEGEILGIAGVDGNGQTELFEALTGLRPSSSGGSPPSRSAIRIKSIVGDFEPTPHRLLKSGVAWIPPDRQSDGLALSLSVEQNLLLNEVREGGALLSPKAMHLKASRMMADFDIRAASPRVAASPLSGGNQQKIVIARALSREPDLLIAASPTRGLDVGAAAYVHKKLRECQERGAAVVLISTELEEIRLLADRIAVFYEGRIMAIVPADTPADRIGLMMGGRALAEARA